MDGLETSIVTADLIER